MKKQKRFWKQALAVLFAICTLSMLSPELVSQAATQTTVQISTKKLTLIKGQKKTLKVKGTKKKVKWLSSKSTIASVSAKGVVTARKAGTTIIKAKVGTKTYSCKVTVEAPKLSKTSLTLKEGKSVQLKVTGTKQKVKWSSSNASVATVTSKGKVTAKQVKKDTRVKITASVGGKKYTCTILVKDVKAQSSETPKPETPSTETPSTETPSTETPSTETPSTETPQPDKPQVSNFSVLKSHILRTGSVNSSGNSFVKMSYTSKGTKYDFAIVYDRIKDQMNFILLTEDSSSQSSVNMYVWENPATAPTEYLFLMKNRSGGFEVTATLDPRTYDGVSPIAFQVKSSVGGAPYSSINNLANSELQLAFAGWSILLKDAGLTFNDLGFIAYKK